MSDTTTRAQMSNVLIIDPDPLVAELLSEAFADEGYQVRVAASVSDAIESVIAKPPAYMLVDLQIPSVRDGRLFAMVSARGYTFPIGLMTTTPALAQSLLVHDQVICIEKPFCLTALLECVAQHARPEPLTV